ncbi:MAG: 2-hydroxyacyl-CoA dehydratase family protein [Dehalococcoidia bacterium]|nr:2-hydroxyacyl-CoA dehydratase family protein [Dehalococcoidia bacterium]
MDTLREVRRINESSPTSAAIEAWKEASGQVVGWACTYVPEEIIYAAGALPVRVVADAKEMELGDANAYLYTTSCSYTRSCLQLALEHKFDFLDGIVGAASCDGMRRLMDMWRNYIPTPFNHTIVVPRKWTDWAHELFLTELVSFKEKLESFLGVSITDEVLSDAIRVYNHSRKLLLALSEMRKGESPPVSGAEVLEVLNASYRMPRESFNELLERLLAEVKATNRKLNGQFRLMLVGSILNNPDFLVEIEELGGLVVTDELCTGTRYWADPVEESGPPLEALARRYLNKFPCPRMQPMHRRLDRVVDMARQWRVDGVVTEVIRHCAPHAWDLPFLREKLEQIDIPVLELDKEYGVGRTGQVRTRVQAFLEMLEGRS